MPECVSLITWLAVITLALIVNLLCSAWSVAAHDGSVTDGSVGLWRGSTLLVGLLTCREF